MILNPKNGNIAVKRLTADEKSAGGILIPENAQDKPQRGIVVATGNGRYMLGDKEVSMDVFPDDEVIFGKWSGTEIDFGPEKLLIMKHTDILAVVIR